MQDDDAYMALAIEEARKAARMGEVPIGAVVVYEPFDPATRRPLAAPRVIARAHNLTLPLHDPTAHAEMQAITMACDYLGGRYLTDCTLYVTIEPCPMCAAALAWAQLGRLVWGADDPKRGFTLFTPSLLHPKTQFEKGVLQEECSSLVSDFFKSKR